MQVAVIRTIASVGSTMVGSGTVSCRTSPVLCQTSARMCPPLDHCHQRTPPTPGNAMTQPDASCVPAAALFCLIGNPLVSIRKDVTAFMFNDCPGQELIGDAPEARIVNSLESFSIL